MLIFIISLLLLTLLALLLLSLPLLRSTKGNHPSNRRLVGLLVVLIFFAPMVLYLYLGDMRVFDNKSINVAVSEEIVPEAVIEKMKAYLAENPEDKEGRYLLGRVYNALAQGAYAAGDYPLATRYWEAALEWVDEEEAKSAIQAALDRLHP